jgi:hypothetical protein
MTVTKAVKRPIEVEVCRYGDVDTGEWYEGAAEDLVAWMSKHVDRPNDELARPNGPWDPANGRADLHIRSKKEAGTDGYLPLRLGQWAILEQNGTGFYPCSDDDMRATYNIVT